jgi:hypothetical protein
MARNYARGFKRLYVVVSIIWALCALAIVAQMPTDNPKHEGDVGLFIVIAFGGPVAGYLFCFGVLPWILRGFK